MFVEWRTEEKANGNSRHGLRHYGPRSSLSWSAEENLESTRERERYIRTKYLK